MNYSIPDDLSIPDFMRRSNVSPGTTLTEAQTRNGVMAKKPTGTKEAALRAKRESGKTETKAKAPKLSELAADIGKPKPSDVTEIPMAEVFGTSTNDQLGNPLPKNPPPHSAPANGPKPVKAKKPAKAKAKKPEPKPTTDLRPDGLRKDSKQSIMLDMALREKGATEEEICKKLGWKRCRVTLKRVCEKVGAKITRDDTGRFFATFPTKKKAA